MHKHQIKRSLAFILAICIVVSLLPMTVIAVDKQVGDSVTTNKNEPPAAVDGAVWVLTDSTECKKIVHTHGEKCFYQSCDHKDGHLATCYSEATAYSLCTHENEAQHTGSVTLTDVVEISGRTVSWKISHPAYSVVYGVYKAAYDEAYASARFGKDLAGRIAGIAALTGKTFCYTTSASATPDKCTHGECSDYTGTCYTKICILEEHEHEDACFQYTWTLKADLNKNGVADDVDQYYVVKYVNDGTVIYEEAILVGMPTPTVDTPSKPADKQYTYQFVGWDIDIADTVTENVTYTAVYTNIVNKYTVTWLDEDGTELEVDENVEYGQMPSYDSKLPEKQGDNTVAYTFAGWAPVVDTVTGDVTYTAQYTTRSVFEVKFFIDGELQKTEYVLDGEPVSAYTPSREHYQLSTWMNGENAYNFNDKVTSSIELHASWKLTESVIDVQTIKATSNWNTGDVCKVGDAATLTFTPDEGYAISKVRVNGQPATVSYNDGIVTLYLTPDATVEKYIVEVQAEKVGIALNPAEMNVFGDLSASAIFDAVYDKSASHPELSATDVKIEYLAFSITLMSKTYEWWVEPGTDVSLESFLNQYGLGSIINYIPKDNLPHEFGAQATEQVRVSFAGNAKYPAISAQTTVAMVDLRTPTSITLNENVVVVYGAAAEDVLKQVFKNVISENSVVTESYKDVTIVVSSLNAGEQTATVTFQGNKEYAPSVAEVSFTVKKATGKVEVESYNGKFGTSVNVSQLITSNANTIQVVLGAQLGANASADAGTVAYVNLPALIDLDAIENETIRNILQKALDKATEGLSGTMSVTQLRDALEAALPYLKTAEEYGYTANLTPETIETVILVLNKMAEAEKVQNLTVNVTFDKDIVVDDAGVYLVAAVTSDTNYTTAFGAGYVVITPDGYRANLGWNVEDENGIVTIEALRNGYDLGASVISVLEGNIEDANKHVHTLFFGVNKNGEMVLTKNQEELDIGAYTELAFIADFGNTMYYAEPIMRAFIVAADVVNVQFVDENGNINNERIFEYGDDASMKALAFDRNGKIVSNGTMSYLYMGMQLNGEFYRDTKAPTRPGAYTVIAVFIGEDAMTVGAAAGALVIKQITPDFIVEDATVQYDGKEHNVIIKDSTGMSCVYVIMDEDGNINVVVPEQLSDGVKIMSSSVAELFEKLDNMKLPSIPEMPEIPEDLLDSYQSLTDAIKEAVNKLKNEYTVKNVTLNGPFPIEKGVYQFTVIGFKDAEHSIVVDDAKLTIACDHIYDNACDADCNVCGETRQVGDHQYVGSENKAPACGAAGEKTYVCTECGDSYTEAVPATGDHTYDNECDNTCNNCDHIREVGDHVYDNACDADCNVCGAVRQTEDHVYVNDCDTDCDVCGAVREPSEHVYDNACDDTCNVCNTNRDVEDHVYDNEYDPDCNICGAVREVPTKCEHAYDNNCDNTCNLCGETREVGEHAYDDEYDADCNECGALRDVPIKPSPEEPVPGTSDTSIGLLALMMTISSAALVVLMLSKKHILYTGKYSK